MSKGHHISPSFSYVPLEESLEVKPKKGHLKIGIPKESTFQENRVPLTPDAVSVLVNNGHRVIIEHDAGEHSSYFDLDYTESGGEIVHEKKEVFQQASIIIKSAPISEEEVHLFHSEHVIISPLHLPFLKTSMLAALMRKKVIALTIDSIKDSSGSYPIVRAMSEIAGRTAILTAGKYLGNKHKGKGVLLGGISGVPPAQVVILGAGVVGEYASRTALGLGATVKVFDNSLFRLMRLQNNVGQRLYTSVIESEELAHSLESADVVVGALKPINGITPVVVTEEMVSNMKSGAVIMDVSIDRGGCFETSRATSHEHPTFKKYDVMHYCVPNIASDVSRTASRAISNVLMPIVLDYADNGGIESLLQMKPGIRNSVYVYKGHVTSSPIAKRFNKKYTDLDLLMPNPI